MKPCSSRVPTRFLVILLSASFGAGTAHAAGEAAAANIGALAGQSAALAISPEQRLREDLRVVLLDMVQSGAFGQTAPEQIAISINEPRQRVGSLGVLVDSASAQSAQDGLRVLGTTPGGSAEHIGLRAGDVLVAVNGVALANLGSDVSGSARAATRLREEVGALDDGAVVSFDVRRGSREINVKGPLASTWIPAVRLTVGDGVALAAAGRGDNGSAPAAGGGCGRISIFDVAPRQQQLHAATLINIDGRLAGVNGQTVFRVSAGEHVLEVGEAIESRYLGINDRQRNAQRKYKTLTVNVAADTTVFVAAQLNEDKRNEWKDGAFWNPVVWRESAEACR